MTKKDISTNPFNIVVIVAALGYFVDIYDLILFGIVRVDSLKAIGIPADQLTGMGINLMNWQMAGMLLGGIVWGIMGDKKGRMSTLFLTILLYSLANIANGFVQNYEQYAILRFIAGFGLAGELGVGITLVAEVMSKKHRAWGTSLVSGVGIVGAVLAFLVAEWGWREAYWVGGVLGLALLALRVYVHDSDLFHKVKESNVKRGNFFSLFSNKSRLIRYISCIFIGMPVWFVIGILIVFSKEFGEALHITGPVNPGKAVMFHYIGASIGSILTAWLSQKLASRKKALLVSISFLVLFTILYFMIAGTSPTVYYFMAFILGIAMGYWAVFITVASEQFGTNIRSTVTTTVPNFVRGAVVGMTLLWAYLSIDMGIIQAAMIIGAVIFAFAIFSVFLLEETHDKDLDYLEH